MSEARGYKDTTVFKQSGAQSGASDTPKPSLVQRAAVVRKIREAIGRTGNRDAQLMLNKLIKDIEGL